MTPLAPTLTTACTVLRAFAASDLDDFAAMWADAAVVRHITGTPSTRSESWARIQQHAGHWALLGYGYWAVTDRDSGRFLGAAGFGDYLRDIDPPIDGTPEAGWVMTTAAQGRGLAREAVGAALDWAERHLPPPRTVCIISPDHAASLRLAAAVGYGDQRLARFKDDNVALLTRNRP